MCVSFFFFFSSRRRHTRLQGDWSSDVCSSDLAFLKVNLLVHRLLVRGYRSAAATCARAGLIPVRASGSKSSSRSEEHTSELQSPCNLVCRLLLEKKKKIKYYMYVR